MHCMVQTGDFDIITRDWLSEMNIVQKTITKVASPSLGYEAGILTQLKTCIKKIIEKKLKVITNAGALTMTTLKEKVEGLKKRKGLKVVVASVVGDRAKAPQKP